ncbi:MAG: hypothetical protein LKH74_05535 [Levilactobacillus sp.]|jgi:hypothetical protein|uniref:Extracellular protein n=1 Tax=Levilactobacillus suantsaiihabitans TaxID=2487722 RepID=A0A4Z0JDL4_9LACO|nr:MULTISPECIES: hypothetical protein [Levilactobacillus]MCI1553370.1 hypothetical protein [Levilactobacillus sp.]MCI1599564.1 hypothetical protein [Levilactobacillus sp.]MCI1606588.1 hypothetical protein [Levilactobacillus sp.]TGD19789.1 hypothetical protein EGT51_02845 [Levilactobacillus suantsaiihabitans]
MRKIGLLGAIILSLGMAAAPVNAQAVPRIQQSSAALATPKHLTSLDDSLVHFVPVPSVYAHAANPHGVNTIASDQGSPVTFTTKYQLPIPGYQHQAWGDPQSSAVVGQYLYVVYCPTAWYNRGRIVRFDMAALNNLQATPQQVQRVYTNAAAQSPQEMKIRAAIKVGPAFTTGHGQSLAYDWATGKFYMWCDQESAPRINLSQYGVLQQISASSLKPVHQIRFRLKSQTLVVPGGHVLAFDRAGHAYFWTRPDPVNVYLYQGTIARNHVHFRLTKQILEHGPGTCVQSLAYNPHNDRLYLVADDSIASLPVAKLAGNGSLTAADVTWTGFASTREFEGLTFGSDGQAYLMSNHNPEILVGNSLNW